MRVITLFIIVALLSGCLLPKEVRKANRAKAKIYRLAKKHNLQHTEIIELHDTLTVPEVKSDTVVNWQQLHVYDTIIIDTGRLLIRLVKLPGDSIYIEGKCRQDTIYYHKTVFVDRPLVKEADVWLIKLWRWVKGFWWLILIIAAGLVIFRQVYKVYF